MIYDNTNMTINFFNTCNERRDLAALLQLTERTRAKLINWRRVDGDINTLITRTNVNHESCRVEYVARLDSGIIFRFFFKDGLKSLHYRWSECDDLLKAFVDAGV